MEEKPRLKPVVYTANSYSKHSKNNFQQMFLLKALRITNDPNELKKMIGVRTVAEVYRTLDKLAMRKEYHAALERSGISFDFIVGGLKEEAVAGEKSADRIKALTVLLKSLGLDKYDSDANAASSWEEELMKSVERDKEKKLLAPTNQDNEIEEYEVKVPETPESMKKMREEEDFISKSIYE